MKITKNDTHSRYENLGSIEGDYMKKYIIVCDKCKEEKEGTITIHFQGVPHNDINGGKKQLYLDLCPTCHKKLTEKIFLSLPLNQKEEIYKKYKL